jgi:dihydrofolate reductase
MKSPVVLIAAVDQMGGIGCGNDLLWVNKADQQHFRRQTSGHTVIMGRKTWDSLPQAFRPLPNRHNVVLTRNRKWQATGAKCAPDMQTALQMANHPPQPIFIIGGASIYALALPLADRLCLTQIDKTFKADAFFPTWDRTQFECIERQNHVDEQGTSYAFVTYQRLTNT